MSRSIPGSAAVSRRPQSAPSTDPLLPKQDLSSRKPESVARYDMCPDVFRPQWWFVPRWGVKRCCKLTSPLGQRSEHREEANELQSAQSTARYYGRVYPEIALRENAYCMYTPCMGLPFSSTRTSQPPVVVLTHLQPKIPKASRSLRNAHCAGALRSAAFRRVVFFSPELITTGRA